MADFDKVLSVIGAIADGIEDSILDCMEQKKDTITMSIKEQLYSGLDGNDEYLSPTYDEDPYFNEKGPWHGAAYAYKKWKEKITPPIRSLNLNLAQRPVNVPNLFINGTFHESIKAEKRGNALVVFTGGFSDGPLIEKKYGESIFMLGDDGKEYFNIYELRPWLSDFFRSCGYR